MKFTLNNQQIFPAGTTVKAYLKTNWPDSLVQPEGEPIGAAAAEAVAAANGDIVLEGLAARTRYWAAAEVGGKWRYVKILTVETPAAAAAAGAPAIASSWGVRGSNTAAQNSAAMALLVAWLNEGGSRSAVLPGEEIALAEQHEITAPNVTISGSAGTVLKPSAALGTKSVFKLAATAEGSVISDLRIIANTSKLAGALRTAAPESRFERITVTGAGAGEASATTGLWVEKTATGARVVNCVVSGIISTAEAVPQGYGVYLLADDSAVEGGKYFNNGHGTIYGQGGGIGIAGVTEESGRRIRVERARAFLNAVHGLYMSGADHLHVDRCSFIENGADATTAGINGRGATVGSGTACLGPKFTNNHLWRNQENGMIIASAAAGAGGSDTSLVRNAIVMGNHARENNQGKRAGGHGIEVNTVGATIIGNDCSHNHNGISVAGVGYRIEGNHCHRNFSSDGTQGNGINTTWKQTKIEVPCTIVLPAGLEGTLTEGSPEVTVAAGGFPGVEPGMQVFAAGEKLPLGVTVLAVAGNKLTLSENANVTGKIALTFASVVATANTEFLRSTQFAAGAGLAATARVLAVTGTTVILTAIPTEAGVGKVITFTTGVGGGIISGNEVHDNGNNGIAIKGEGEVTYDGPIVTDNRGIANGWQNREAKLYDLYVDNNAKNGTYRDNFTRNISQRISIGDTNPNTGGNRTGSDTGGLFKSITYSAAISLSGEQWTVGRVTATNGTAFEIKEPEKKWIGRQIIIFVRNGSGGVLGTLTWAAGYKLAGAWVNPLSEKLRGITFMYMGAEEGWREIARDAADLPG